MKPFRRLLALPAVVALSVIAAACGSAASNTPQQPSGSTMAPHTTDAMAPHATDAMAPHTTDAMAPHTTDAMAPATTGG